MTSVGPACHTQWAPRIESRDSFTHPTLAAQPGTKEKGTEYGAWAHGPVVAMEPLRQPNTDTSGRTASRTKREKSPGYLVFNHTRKQPRTTQNAETSHMCGQTTIHNFLKKKHQEMLTCILQTKTQKNRRTPPPKQAGRSDNLQGRAQQGIPLLGHRAERWIPQQDFGWRRCPDKGRVVLRHKVCDNIPRGPASLMVTTRGTPHRRTSTATC